MAVVYPLLHKCVQAFAPICAIAETELYNPILRGAKLHLLGPSASHASLEQMLDATRRIEELPNTKVDIEHRIENNSKEDKDNGEDKDDEEGDKEDEDREDEDKDKDNNETISGQHEHVCYFVFVN